jgi:hypothetical protein
VRRAWDAPRLTTTELANEQMSALFQGVVEATEEAILNSLFMATTTTGNCGSTVCVSGFLAAGFAATASTQRRRGRRELQLQGRARTGT